MDVAGQPIARANIQGSNCADEQASNWSSLVAGGSRHLATDCANYIQTPWAKTHNC